MQVICLRALRAWYRTQAPSIWMPPGGFFCVRVVVVCATHGCRIWTSICACMCVRARAIQDRYSMLRVTCPWKTCIRKQRREKHRHALARPLARSRARARAHSHMQPMYENHPPPMRVGCGCAADSADSAPGCLSVIALRLQLLHDWSLPASPGQHFLPAGHRGFSATSTFSVELVEVVCLSR